MDTSLTKRHRHGDIGIGVPPDKKFEFCYAWAPS